jgi:hypothetical protein
MIESTGDGYPRLQELLIMDLTRPDLALIPVMSHPGPTKDALPTRVEIRKSASDGGP